MRLRCTHQHAPPQVKFNSRSLLILIGLFHSSIATVFLLPEAAPRMGAGGGDQEQAQMGGRGERDRGLEAWRPVAADMLPLITMNEILKSPLW